MRPIWKGAISFGLVTIPVGLYSATEDRRPKFRQLRQSDHSPIKYKRVAENDGNEVPYEDIVKGYEVDKGR
ncbi:MAG: Ku protein, partial [Acidimicrobiia bacterium]|nr:Ku protein [Acidimicrobiia bacterium]